MHLRRVAVTAGLAVLTLGLTACGADSGTGPTTPVDDAHVQVVASTDVYGSIAEAVGGDHVAVTSIIDDPAKDPHEYETTPADALAVGKAAIVIVNGGGYDDFATRLVETAATKPVTLDVAQLSGLVAATPAGEEFNEHVWYDLPTVKKLADRLAVELGKADPADAAVFTANAAAFGTKIDGLTAKLTAIKATHDGRPIAVTEP